MSRRYLRSFGVVFDIDGVLLRGNKPIDGAARVLKRLQVDGIPNVIMTNGGGYTEEFKAQQLSEKLKIHIDPERLCLCHTPMKSLVEKHEKERVLLVGKNYETLESAARQYGFQNIITVEQLHSLYPLLYPDIPHSPDVLNQKHRESMEERIGAILIMMDPIYWGRELQIIMDVLCSEGNLISPSASRPNRQIPVYNACSDFQYAGEFKAPRYGAGAFRMLLEELYSQTTGEKLKQKLFGKPQKASFEYAERLIQSQCDGRVVETIYMIGDNPETDIRGANEAGDQWKSILTRTGVFENKTNHDADYVVPSVVEALEIIRQLHK